MSVIANTAVISNWAAIGKIEVLRLLFTRLFVSTEVYEEVLAGSDDGYSFYEAVRRIVESGQPESWIQVTPVTGMPEFRTFTEGPTKLHRGETSSIAIAQARAWLFLSDDAAARKHARRLQVAVSGTLGCLVLAIERGHITLAEANGWLATMVERGYRSPVTDLQAFLKGS